MDCGYFDTTRYGNHSGFLTPTMVGGRCLFPVKYLLKVTHPTLHWNCAKIFKFSDIQYISLTLDKKLNSLIYRTLFYVNTYGSYKLSKNSPVFLGRPCSNHVNFFKFHFNLNHCFKLQCLSTNSSQMLCI